MSGRSSHRRSPPPPPLISQHSPARGRVRSPSRQHLDISSGRAREAIRERREYRPRTSRSPTSKRRSFSPPMKRKASPSGERELQRRAKISKSPVGTRHSSEQRSYIPEPDVDSHPVRSVSGSGRFREREYDGEREQRALPQFRGPEGSVNFDISELKKFTIEIIRKPSSANDDGLINRNIINPDDIHPVRRPGMRGIHPRGKFDKRNLPPRNWMDQNNEEYLNPYTDENEGSRPIFLRSNVATSSSKDRELPPEDYRRIVAINTARGGARERERSRERIRNSPGPYEESRRFSEREHSPYDVRHRSPPPRREEYIEHRDSRPQVHAGRRGSSREDLRRDLDGRRREERKFSPDRRSYERESDLRSRIIEKRNDSNMRSDEREREHSSSHTRRYEVEKERHTRPHHSPPPPPARERKRGGSVERERHEGSRRGEAWDRDREREKRGERESTTGRDEKRRRPHSREREDKGERERGGRERYESSEHYDDSSDRRRSSQPHKTDFESKKYYKHYEEKEFVPHPTRGRGGPPMRRGMPPMVRGRGMVRGLNRGFRGMGMPMIPRGMPRPFMPMRGFPPRKSTY